LGPLGLEVRGGVGDVGDGVGEVEAPHEVRGLLRVDADLWRRGGRGQRGVACWGRVGVALIY
jgi:hypothetical protein